MKQKAITVRNAVSTGSTLLNLACTDNPFCGFVKGGYYFLVGDSSSGKTFLSLTCLAEAARSAVFRKYRFIYDNSENGAHMSVEKFFGKRVAKRLEAPAMKDGQPVFSGSIEEFYYHVDDAIKADQPFIYILDSMDSLTSSDEQAKFDEHKDAHRKGKTAAGSYGDGKAKKNSANLRRLITPLERSGSILIIINQTRDNLGFGFEKKTRSGGNSLKFYASLEMWSSVKGRIHKTVRGKKRQIGIDCKIQLKKNRMSGKERTITFPIYHSYGIDDIGGCIDYLIDEGHWSKKGNTILAKEFKIKGTRDKLIKTIETNGDEKALRTIVGEVWNEIEEACALKRKKRYE